MIDDDDDGDDDDGDDVDADNDDDDADDGSLDRHCAVPYVGFKDEVRQLYGASSAEHHARSKPHVHLDSACPQDEARRRPQHPGQQPISTRTPDMQCRRRQ